MANVTDPLARSVHGTNPQNLIEYITRQKIYDSLYWKEECFGLTASDVAAKATKLQAVGGSYGGNYKPTRFLCLVLKLLQIQPEDGILEEFLQNEDFKYVRAVGAFYLRLTGRPAEIYDAIEPLYNDYRRLRFRDTGGWRVAHVDEFADELLTSDRYCGIALPHLPRRSTLVSAGYLDGPRRSAVRPLVEERGGGDPEMLLKRLADDGNATAKEALDGRRARRTPPEGPGKEDEKEDVAAGGCDSRRGDDDAGDRHSRGAEERGGARHDERGYGGRDFVKEDDDDERRRSSRRRDEHDRGDDRRHRRRGEDERRGGGGIGDRDGDGDGGSRRGHGEGADHRDRGGDDGRRRRDDRDRHDGSRRRRGGESRGDDYDDGDDGRNPSRDDRRDERRSGRHEREEGRRSRRGGEREDAEKYGGTLFRKSRVGGGKGSADRDEGGERRRRSRGDRPGERSSSGRRRSDKDDERKSGGGNDATTEGSQDYWNEERAKLGMKPLRN